MVNAWLRIWRVSFFASSSLFRELYRLASFLQHRERMTKPIGQGGSLRCWLYRGHRLRRIDWYAPHLGKTRSPPHTRASFLAWLRVAQPGDTAKPRHKCQCRTHKGRCAIAALSRREERRDECGAKSLTSEPIGGD